MPRRPLNRPDKKTELIQIMVAPQEKEAFDAWCAANSTTMSEVLRLAMSPYVKKGQEILNASALNAKNEQAALTQSQSI